MRNDYFSSSLVQDMLDDVFIGEDPGNPPVQEYTGITHPESLTDWRDDLLDSQLKEDWDDYAIERDSGMDDSYYKLP